MPTGARGTLKNKYALMRLCGWVETDGNESTPPKVYKKMTAEDSGTGESEQLTYTCGDPDDPDEPSQSITYTPNTTVYTGSQSIESTFDTATSSSLCSYGTPEEGSIGATITRRTVGDPENPPFGCGNKIVKDNVQTYGPVNVFGGTIRYNRLLRFGGWWQFRTIDSSTVASTFTAAFSGGKTSVFTISSEDTDAAVVARTTLIELPNGGIAAATPKTLWETRSTGIYFDYQQCEFQIECKGLVKGLTYKATAEVRRRTAVIGSYGEWSDVSFTPQTFVATGEDQKLPGDEQYYTLPQAQGYEYEITDVDCYLA